MTTPISTEPACVIEVGHPEGTPAIWRDALHPQLTVCDRHRGQYDTSEFAPIAWEPITCPHGVTREPGYWCADCEGMEPF